MSSTSASTPSSSSTPTSKRWKWFLAFFILLFVAVAATMLQLSPKRDARSGGKQVFRDEAEGLKREKAIQRIIATAPLRPTDFLPGMSRRPAQRVGEVMIEELSRPISPPSQIAYCQLDLLSTRNCDEAMIQYDWGGCLASMGPPRQVADLLLSRKCRATHFCANELTRSFVGTPSRLIDIAYINRSLVYESYFEGGLWQGRDAMPQRAGNGTTIPARIPPKYDAEYVDRVTEVPDMGPPLVYNASGVDFTVYPITFAFPLELMAQKVSRVKLFHFNPLRASPYPMGPLMHAVGGEEEWLLHSLARHSFFTFTHKRGGWDCMRHYEILASGGVPYFADILQVPKHTLASFPKKLLEEAVQLPGMEHIGYLQRDDKDGKKLNSTSQHLFGVRKQVFSTNSVFVNWRNYNVTPYINMTTFDKQKYFRIADALLEHTRKYLSSASMVKYVLHTMGLLQNRTQLKVLFVGRGVYDYMATVMAHGLASLGVQTTAINLGVKPRERLLKLDLLRSFYQNTSVERRVPLTADEIRSAAFRRTIHFYGKGFAYGARFPHNVSFKNLQEIEVHPDDALRKVVSDGHFDAVLYGTDFVPFERLPYVKFIPSKMWREKRVAWIFGGDDFSVFPERVTIDNCRRIPFCFRREIEVRTRK